MNKFSFILGITIISILSCSDNKKPIESKKIEILKIKELGFLKPFKCTIYKYSKKFTGYIVPYLYYVENNTDSNLYKININTSFGITSINNTSILNNSGLNFSNGCQIYDPNLNTYEYDDFNPLLPRKSFHCLGFLSFMNEDISNQYTPSPINILDNGELLKYMNSNILIKTKFEISSITNLYNSHSMGFPKFETLIYDTTSFMKDILKFKNMNHKSFNGDHNLKEEIYNYIYTQLTKSKDDFIIIQQYK